MSVSGPVRRVIDDVLRNKRAFLPGGPPPSRSRDLVANMQLPILFDGLCREEAALILSLLPIGTKRVFVSPLDKGLSGSKVFAARYDVAGHARTKTYVLKVGSRDKISIEATAIRDFAAPHVDGINVTVHRLGGSNGVLAQELAGLTGPKPLVSLRNHVRDTEDGANAVKRLFTERLKRLYGSNGTAHSVDLRLGTVLQPYLRKARPNLSVDSTWGMLRKWVHEATGHRWRDPRPLVKELRHHLLRARRCIVHGDLHTQNVLVDEKGECWPIDFAWCRDKSTPLVDLLMMEASLKFLALPMRSDLRWLIELEDEFAREYLPRVRVPRVPYGLAIRRVLDALAAVRTIARDQFAISFDDYRKGLLLMTYSQTSHPKLNRPLVLASLQVLCALERGSN